MAEDMVLAQKGNDGWQIHDGCPLPLLPNALPHAKFPYIEFMGDVSSSSLLRTTNIAVLIWMFVCFLLDDE